MKKELTSLYRYEKKKIYDFFLYRYNVKIFVYRNMQIEIEKELTSLYRYEKKKIYDFFYIAIM